MSRNSQKTSEHSDIESSHQLSHDVGKNSSINSPYMDPVEFGKLLGKLDAIEKKLDALEERSVSRLDDLEDRVEVLEKTDASRTFSRTAWDRFVWTLIGGGFIAAALGMANTLGVV